MNINSNFEINIRSVEEFARVMVPEALDCTLNLTCNIDSENIQVDMEIDGKQESFIYKNHQGKIEDQEVTMTKILLLKFFNKDYSWGGLMGVRPTKVVRRYLLLGYTYDEIRKILKEFMLVHDEKIELLIEVVKKELELLDKEHINLYIGIPFCPTKCKYCSFASYEINGGVGRYYDGFVATLLEEIKLVGEFLKDENLKVSSIYIGGGTPSTLKEKDLEDVLKYVDKYIDKSDLKEFTFEAGREDAINYEKLKIAKDYGVDRISLNPQTFNIETLKKLKKGQIVDVKALEIKESETSPPKRYNSGAMILAMENAGKLIEDDDLREQIKTNGIGTSATRAEILNKLNKIDYTKLNKKTQIITPTPMGEMIYDVVDNSVPSLLRPELTASWEKGLSMVADGEINSDEYMIKLENYIKKNTNTVMNLKNNTDVMTLFSDIPGNKRKKPAKSSKAKKVKNALGKCTVCETGQILENKKAYFCTNWREGCKFTVWKNTLENYKLELTPDMMKELLKNKSLENVFLTKPNSDEKAKAKLSLNKTDVQVKI